MAEQIIGGPEADVVALKTGARRRPPTDSEGATAVAPPPKTRFVDRILPDQERYARKTNVVAIRHELGDVVAVVEIVSPGNKDRTRSLRTFADKAIDLMTQRVNLLIIDPFPPGPHDPQGMHGAIWNELTGGSFELPRDKPLTFASYQVEPIQTAYVETIAAGDPLPDMALFLDGDFYVNVPLEETYETTWNVLPIEIRRQVEQP